MVKKSAHHLVITIITIYSIFLFCNSLRSEVKKDKKVYRVSFAQLYPETSLHKATRLTKELWDLVGIFSMTDDELSEDQMRSITQCLTALLVAFNQLGSANPSKTSFDHLDYLKTFINLSSDAIEYVPDYVQKQHPEQVGFLRVGIKQCQEALNQYVLNRF